jgi:hypothetical protein
MLLYHGSNQTVTVPKIRKSTRGMDFGEGFYLTSNEKQARKFGFIVRNRAKRLHLDPIGVPTVSVYTFDEESAKPILSTHIFEKPTKEWLFFVRDNRRKIYSGPKYDLVIGPLANDNVFTVVQLFENGIYDAAGAIDALMTYRLDDQYCLKTETALDFIQYVRHYTMEGEGND